MKKRTSSTTKRGLSSLMAVVLCFSLTACANGNETKNVSSNFVKTMNLQVTEEGNPDVKMDNQPISSFWFPEQLLKWNPKEDPNLSYNISTVPLANRVEKDKLSAVNKTQNKDTKVVALSIMNASTSGNPSQGTNKFDSNTFTYWQYIDMLVYWGGSSGEGLIVPPSPDVTNGAHRNGVPVLGTIFFPMTAHGGKTAWLDEFLIKDSSGNFPIADKLIEVANIYGFDGWFINQETEGSKDSPLTKQHADLMKEFINQYKEKAGDSQQIMWYDSMTTEGKMDWQNALTDKNASFLLDKDKQPVADSMFLNFWWTGNEHADTQLNNASEVITGWVKEQKSLTERELLKASNAKAEELGIDPYSLYAGVDVQQDGTATPIRWDLFEESIGKTFTSLGLYCPSWTYFSAESTDDFEQKENTLWVNSLGNPSMESNAKGTSWRGISTYIVEKSVVNTVPFISNFNTGNGYSFFMNGEKVSDQDWNNRSMTDIMPTYRYIIENEGNNKLTPSLNFADAYYGGNSIKLRGDMEKGKSSTLKLYSSDLLVDKDFIFTTALKATSETDVSAILTLEDGSTAEIKGNKAIGTEWTTINFDLGKLKGKTVRSISLKFSSKEAVDNLEIYLGNITITKEEINKETSLSAANVDSTVFDDESMFAGVRMSFTPDSEEIPRHYEIYRINEDSTKSFMGVSTSPNYYINGLQRSGETTKMEFEIFPLNQNFVRGKSVKTAMEWPDNSLPKADFKVSHTIAAPGENVTFTSTSTQNTEELSWSFEGAEPSSSTDANPTVTYQKEGVYKVSLTAKNKKGENTKEAEGLITVTEKAASGLVNLSHGKSVEATSFVNPNEAPPFAVDGKYETKWCATGTPPHEITIDLGGVKTIGEVATAHAEAGNEGADMNTQKYTISVSLDGVTFTEIAANKNNQLANSLDCFPAVDARYVRLSVTKPAQGSDTAARIYEVEVFGLDK